MYLYELGTRPWEAKTPEERERIERYEAILELIVAGELARKAHQRLVRK